MSAALANGPRPLGQGAGDDGIEHRGGGSTRVHVDGGGGSSCSTWYITSLGLPPNGGAPVSSSYSSTPQE